MLQISQDTCTNTLLRMLPEEDFRALAVHLQRVEFARSDYLIRANQPIDNIVFPEGGIFSIVLTSPTDQRQIEVGIFGREGVSDGSILAGIDRVPHECFVQVSGPGLRMSADTFLSIANERPAIRALVQRWLHVLGIQTAHTALTNGTYNVEQRLARWLLMCQDRLGGNNVELTHEFVGKMLGVQRSTVTLTIHILEGARLIKATRGEITILNRQALLEIANGSYGISEAEYERIIGPFREET